MPNHVKNIVKMKGITKLPFFKREKDERTGAEVTLFDFNKIIPMPESLNVTSGSKEDTAIEAVLRKLGQHRFSGKDYATMSDEDYAKRRKWMSETEEELQKLGLLYISNKILYGATTWYDWCVDNWDTKWNAYQNEQPDEDTITFETAWSSPQKVIEKMAQMVAEMYPDTVIEHWWADEDCGNNTGYAIYENGQQTDICWYDSCSNEAYETYIMCWGASSCFYKDEKGNWRHHDCGSCHGCD